MNLNDFKAKASSLAQTAAIKSRQMAAIAKLKAANLGEEDAIRKAYIELGKQYYAMYGDHPEDEFSAACNIIKEARATIDTNNDMINEMKNGSIGEDIATAVVEETIEEDIVESEEETVAEKASVEAEEEALADEAEPAAEEDTPEE